MDWAMPWNEPYVDLPKLQDPVENLDHLAVEIHLPFVHFLNFKGLYVPENLPLWLLLIPTCSSVFCQVLLWEDLSLHRAWSNGLTDIYSPSEIKIKKILKFSKRSMKCHFTEWVHLKEQINQKIVLYMHLNALWLPQSVTDHHISLWKRKLQTDCGDLRTLGQQGL